MAQTITTLQKFILKSNEKCEKKHDVVVQLFFYFSHTKTSMTYIPTKQTASNIKFQASLVALIAIMSVTMSLDSVYATTTVTNNPAISCGSEHWGLKEHDGAGTAGPGSFTDTNHDCTNDTTYKSRTNAAKLQVELDSTVNQYEISWDAVFQGEDPWGITDNDEGNAENHNSAFDSLSSTHNYNLKTQWVWTNDQTPYSGDSDNVAANFLTNLWFQKDANTILVIDFLVDRLESDDGDWVQASISDASPWWLSGADGLQYYEPFCKKVDGITEYHFNVVLDTNNRAADSWWESVANVDDEIDEAFDWTGYINEGSTCSSTDPGNRSDYDIVDQETGIEIQALEDLTGTSNVEGGFSWSELYY